MLKRGLILAIVSGLLFTSVYAQENPQELTEEQALKILEECKSKTAELQKQIDSLQQELNNLKAIESQKKKKIQQLEQEIADLEKEISKWPTEYTVQKGDYLAKIAAKPYIYNNAKAWPRIYRANRHLIKNPNLIYPGWVLKIPHGLDRSIEVIPGDCLWKIAGFYWIYNNPRQWTKIYEANKDKIKDPNLIYPGQELIIPRD